MNHLSKLDVNEYIPLSFSRPDTGVAQKTCVIVELSSEKGLPHLATPATRNCDTCCQGSALTKAGRRHELRELHRMGVLPKEADQLDKDLVMFGGCKDL